MKWLKNLWPSLLLVALVPYMMGTTWSTVGIFSSVESSGTVFINDTVNSKMTIGLTVNTGTNDNEAVATKSTDVAHVFTAITEANTYGILKKTTAAGGGLYIQGFTDDAGQPQSIILEGNADDAATIDDSNTTSAKGIVTIRAFLENDSNGQSDFSTASVVGNILVVGDGALAQLMVKEDGELYINLERVVFDSHNDASVIEDFENFKATGREVLDYATMRATTEYDKLVALGLVGEVSETDWNAGVRPLFSFTRQVQLLAGDSRQKQARLDAMLDVFEEDPEFRGKMRAAMAARGVEHLARPELP